MGVSVCGCVNAVWALSTVRVCQWVAWRQNLVFSNFLSSSSRNQIENSPEVTVGEKCKFGKKKTFELNGKRMLPAEAAAASVV